MNVLFSKPIIFQFTMKQNIFNNSQMMAVTGDSLTEIQRFKKKC